MKTPDTQVPEDIVEGMRQHVNLRGHRFAELKDLAANDAEAFKDRVKDMREVALAAAADGDHWPNVVADTLLGEVVDEDTPEPEDRPPFKPIWPTDQQRQSLGILAFDRAETILVDAATWPVEKAVQWWIVVRRCYHKDQALFILNEMKERFQDLHRGVVVEGNYNVGDA